MASRADLIRRSAFGAVALTALLAACGSTTRTNTGQAAPAKTAAATTAKAITDSTVDKAMTETTAKVMTDSTVANASTATTAKVMTDSTVDKAMTDKAMTDLAPWQKLSVTDVRTGEAFTLGDIHGKPVYVENFATWCPNCRKQLGNVQQAAKAAGDKAAFVALSVETDLSAAKVAKYAKDNGFDDVRFAVMTPEMLAAMSEAFGKTAVNPPSTPHVWVSSAGKVGALATGYEDAAKLATNLDASMHA